MKLRQKFVLLSVMPVIFLGTILFLFASNKIRESITQEAYTGMHASTLAVRSIFEAENSGEYRLDEKGEFWKGDTLNISQATDIVDQIKSSTNMEVTVFYNDTRYLTTIVNEKGERQINTQASDTVVQTVLKNGQDYKSDNVDILGTKYIVYYIPLYQANSQTPIGMVFLGTKQSEVIDLIKTMQKELSFIVWITTLIVSISTLLILQKTVKALTSSVDAVNVIASGQLNIVIEDKYKDRKDEIGDMCRSIEKLDKKLIGIIGEIKDNTDYLTNASTKLDGAAKEAAASIGQVDFVIQEIAAGSSHQALSTEEAAADVTVMGGMVDETMNVITDLNATTTRMKNASDEANDTLLELNNSMNSVMDAIVSINNQTNKTNESVVKISAAAKLITAIAHQTNLLALNASIEAARAGEHGKGFGVVATEIKHLSTQSNQATKEIQNMLVQLTDNSNQAVTTMLEVKDTISTQKVNLNRTVEVFHTVSKGIEQSVEGIYTIAKKTDVLDGARKKTVGVVGNLASIAEENAAGTQEAAASVEEVGHLVQEVAEHASGLKTISEGLKNSLDVFRL